MILKHHLYKELRFLNRANSNELALLLDACKNGVEKAQLQLYQLYFKAMFNTAFRIVKEDALAEDIMQESFLAAFEKLDQYKAEVSFGAWLKKIVINKSISEYRKKVKKHWLSIDESRVHEPINDQSTEDHTEKTKWIYNKIKGLNERYAMTLTLNLIEGYDYKEIAEILEITEGTSRTLLSRAKDKLRNEITKDPQWKKIS